MVEEAELQGTPRRAPSTDSAGGEELEKRLKEAQTKNRGLARELQELQMVRARGGGCSTQLADVSRLIRSKTWMYA